MKDIFSKMETSYESHKRAEQISNKLYKKLEGQRSYFWQVVGDPPLLKPFKALLQNQWTPSIAILVLVAGFCIAASVFAHSIGLVVIGMGIIFVMYMVRGQEERLYVMNRTSMRRFKDKYFFERGPGSAYERYHGK